MITKGFDAINTSWVEDPRRLKNFDVFSDFSWIHFSVLVGKSYIARKKLVDRRNYIVFQYSNFVYTSNGTFSSFLRADVIVAVRWFDTTCPVVLRLWAIIITYHEILMKLKLINISYEF